MSSTSCAVDLVWERGDVVTLRILCGLLTSGTAVCVPASPPWCPLLFNLPHNVTCARCPVGQCGQPGTEYRDFWDSYWEQATITSCWPEQGAATCFPVLFTSAGIFLTVLAARRCLGKAGLFALQHLAVQTSLITEHGSQTLDGQQH